MFTFSALLILGFALGNYLYDEFPPYRILTKELCNILDFISGNSKA